MILKITKNTDPIWKQKFKSVGTVDSKVKKIVADMKETLEFTGGVGLAAPQVNIPLKLFIVNYGKLKEAFINPQLSKKAKSSTEGEEGCLSVPGFRGLLRRSSELNIDYLDVKGRKKQARITGFYARIIQHEYDHLKSVFYIDRITDNKKKLIQFSPVRLVFFGTPEFSSIILKSIIGQAVVGEYEVLAVVTQPDSGMRSKSSLEALKVKSLAEKFSIPVTQPLKLSGKSIVKYLENLKPDVFIVASYGQILPKSILRIPKHGSLNLHASLLPKYRGASPIQQAVLNKERYTGITIMLMNEKMDEGDILGQVKVRIRSKETSIDLELRLARIGAEFLHQILHLWVNKKLKPRRQLITKATYTKRLTKDSGYIDWKKPPKKLESMVRAYYPWPGVWTNYNGKILKLLPEKKVQLEGRQPIKLSDFVQGHKDFKLNLD